MRRARYAIYRLCYCSREPQPDANRRIAFRRSGFRAADYCFVMRKYRQLHTIVPNATSLHSAGYTKV